MFKLHKNMNEEIKKYNGRIFYFDVNKKKIRRADWIFSTADYDHNFFELHHVVPFTDWERNTRNVQSLVNNALILIPKVMHQHLENPIYKLNKEDFERIYGINPDLILFDINSRNSSNANNLFTINTSTLTQAGNTISLSANFLLTEEDLSCFDWIDEDYSKIKGLGIENIVVDDCGVCRV